MPTSTSPSTRESLSSAAVLCAASPSRTTELSLPVECSAGAPYITHPGKPTARGGYRLPSQTQRIRPGTGAVWVTTHPSRSPEHGSHESVVSSPERDEISDEISGVQTHGVRAPCTEAQHHTVSSGPILCFPSNATPGGVRRRQKHRPREAASCLPSLHCVTVSASGLCVLSSCGQIILTRIRYKQRHTHRRLEAARTWFPSTNASEPVRARRLGSA
ncbi:hypothetical protein FA95DRAFT_967317 [Auriscalpium vulgare]|uniref:Uncharacterized protein n=1 Tax=Auriscalpium vulgare TaxID=40419 RepID=A0ACB8R7B8_9AGAM|nr:hypothetical protein FA95DRAFT_967317 [Auriscalpium vulgare]